MPIWIIYWFPLILFMNYMIKFALLNIILLICKKVTKSAIHSAVNIIKSMFFAICTEIIGLAVFYVLEINTEPDFYYGWYMIFSLTIFFAIAIFNFLLNHKFVIKKVSIPAGQKIVVGILVVIATAPHLFLLPPGPLVY